MRFQNYFCARPVNTQRSSHPKKEMAPESLSRRQAF
jgi:hypothetical protein